MMPAQVDFAVQAELHRAAFEQGPDAIICATMGGSILAVNIQAELLTGIPRAELVGTQVELLIPTELRAQHAEHRARFARNPYRRLMGPNLQLVVLQRTDGDPVPIRVDINLAPVPISIGVVVVLTIRQRDASPWGDDR